MKRYVAFFLSVLLLATMTACGAISQHEIETEPSAEETTSSQRPEKQPSDQQDIHEPVQTTDTALAYSELVERFRDLVSDPFGQDSDMPGEMGVLETARAAGDNAVYEMKKMLQVVPKKREIYCTEARQVRRFCCFVMNTATGIVQM